MIYFPVYTTRLKMKRYRDYYFRIIIIFVKNKKILIFLIFAITYNSHWWNDIIQNLPKDCLKLLLSLSAIIFENDMLRLGFPFAKLLRNFCGTKCKIFLSLRISFGRKNNNLRNHSQKSFRAKLPYSAFAELKFCAIP